LLDGELPAFCLALRSVSVQQLKIEFPVLNSALTLL